MSSIEPPPFDAALVDALSIRSYRVSYIVEDADPDPNDVRKLMLATRLGSWVMELADDGVTWTVDGRPVGPNMQRQGAMSLSFHTSKGHDLSRHQGPEAAARFHR